MPFLVNGQVKLTTRLSVTYDLEFQQGDIVVVPFPYTDRKTEKRRPALVISSGEITRQHGLIWLAMITSSENQSWTGDVAIAGQSSGLGFPSVIRVAKLATVDAGGIIRVAGKLDAGTWERVRSTLLSNLK